LAAIRALRRRAPHDAYRDAWAEWDASGEAEDWDAVVGDGASDRPDHVPRLHPAL
jgi:hypothetical protein